jgi:hypothetical protein
MCRMHKAVVPCFPGCIFWCLIYCSSSSYVAKFTTDVQPDRPDERARIESVGGHVIYLNGPRVRGILAMSRALGIYMSALPLRCCLVTR